LGACPTGRWWAGAALAVVTLVAFSNSFSTGFALDNQVLILGDTRIQSASAANAELIVNHTYWWPNGESGLYRPLTTFSYLFNYAILEDADRPAGYHWINFFLHTANVILLFALMLRLLAGRARAFWAACAIAALWAVHPVLTESVTNIVGRADLLAGFAVLSGVHLYLTSLKTVGWRRGAAFAGLVVAAAMGAFSKESAVVLPGVIVVYEFASKRQWRKMWPGLLATAAPVGIMLWQRVVVLSASLPAEYPFADNPITGASFFIGRLTAIKILARYLWLAVWPLKLSADYSYSQIPLARGSVEDWVCWIAIAAALAATLILWNRSRLAFFFIAFAFLNLLPASNLLFPIGALMAERLMYLPLAGLVAAVVIVIDQTVDQVPVSNRALAICTVVIVCGFAVRTWLRNRDWTDDKTMAAAGIENAPSSFKFHRLLAAQLISGEAVRRETDRAMAEADRSVAILGTLPDELDLPGPWNLAAVCHRVKADSLSGDDAREQYAETARLAKRSIEIDIASREAYARRHGKSPVPASAADAYRTLASAYLHLNRPAEALEAATRAQAIDPANAGVYDEMADAYFAQQRGEDAAVTLAEGGLLTGDRNLREELIKLYQGGLDEQGCAVVRGPRGPALNPNCAIVRRNLCEAAVRARRPDLSRQLGCPN
jgi:tetratricopeptide (TPR) repeat protein